VPPVFSDTLSGCGIIFDCGPVVCAPLRPPATSGAVFTAPASFSINASASDADGSISTVEFFEGGTKLYHINADGSGQVRLTNNSANDEAPRWSPNSTRIAFQSDRANPFSGMADIYVMNADGSNQFTLSNSGFGDYGASW